MGRKNEEKYTVVLEIHGNCDNGFFDISERSARENKLQENGGFIVGEDF